jgi:hypothetical protein
MAKWNNYTQYKCECGKPAAKGSINSKRKDGSLPPRVSCLTKRPACAQCFNNAVAKKNSKYDTYEEMQEAKAIEEGFSSLNHKINSKTYRGKKYDIPYCENKDGKLGFECAVKESYWDGSDESIKNLEVDHIDGNPNNNHDSNLMVLCPMCHKTKGRLNGDNVSAGRKKLGVTKPGIRTFG